MVGLNTQQPHLMFLFVLALGLFSCSVESMRFDLPSEPHKCIAEYIKKNSMTFGNYSIVNPNEGHPLNPNLIITVQVYTHGGKNSHHYAPNVQSGQFSFVAQQSDDYIVCFWNSIEPHVTLSIDFVWKTGVVTKDFPNIAKKTNIDIMTWELEKLHETAISIKDEIIDLRESDEEMLDFNSITNTRMLWLSFISFLVCFSVAGLQLWHLKTFFQKNKLL